MRLKSFYRCQQCGFSSPKWLGQCPDCQTWNTMAEEAEASAPVSGKLAARSMTEFSSEVVSLAQASLREPERIATGVSEFDRLLGGGLVAGQVLLLAGPPGIGKSTLMLQVAAGLGGCKEGGASVLYVSGEESSGQVSARARRLGIGSAGVSLLSETNLAKVITALEKTRPKALILDSVQTVYHPELGGSPGSVGQVRECAAELLRAAKSREMVLFLLGHVTKEGALAGPKVLEHLVDTVLYFDNERHQLLRVLRVQKNRFGPSSEIGLFEMGERGLTSVPDASALFLSERGGKDLPGRSVSVAMEGSRPLLIEVQALVAPTRYPLPRRMATGLDLTRSLVLLASLEKHLRLRLEHRDVFLGLAGGLRQRDPALDLAVCGALVSSSRDVPLPSDHVFVGEVGLLGQVGRVPSLGLRLREARKMGFKKAVVPARAIKELRGSTGLELEGVEDIADFARRFVGAPDPGAPSREPDAAAVPAARAVREDVPNGWAEASVGDDSWEELR